MTDLPGWEPAIGFILHFEVYNAHKVYKFSSFSLKSFLSQVFSLPLSQVSYNNDQHSLHQSKADL